MRLVKTLFKSFCVLIFAALICAILCWLNAANEQEVADFEQVYAQIPVELTVTNLTGNRTDNLGIPEWLGALFDTDSMNSYVRDVQMKARHEINNACDFYGDELMGVTSLELAAELDPYRGAVVNYYPGYDETMFAEDALLCLIPEAMEHCVAEDGTVTLAFRCLKSDPSASTSIEDRYVEIEIVFTVAGTYSIGYDCGYLFCPYFAVDYVYVHIGCQKSIDSIHALLADNNKLEDFREFATKWFAEPNVSGEKTPWDFSSYDYYPYALDIDDTMLKQVSAVLGASIAINQFAALMVFILSAGAGFFLGFLMIRSRKREIILMRTLGKANGRIYLDFAFEQMLRLLLGVVIGGAVFAWQPVERLMWFAVVYFVGLSTALIVFLNSKLITNMKEDE